MVVLVKNSLFLLLIVVLYFISIVFREVELKRGPTSARTFGSIDVQQTGDECMEVKSLLHHNTDHDSVFQKMRETFRYRLKMLHVPQQLADVLHMFPCFLDTKGLVGSKCL